jgi:hypothetical protein
VRRRETQSRMPMRPRPYGGANSRQGPPIADLNDFKGLAQNDANFSLPSLRSLVSPPRMRGSRLQPDASPVGCSLLKCQRARWTPAFVRATGRARAS